MFGTLSIEDIDSCYGGCNVDYMPVAFCGDTRSVITNIPRFI